MLEVPDAFLAERHKLGLDKRDEMWEGELRALPVSLRAVGGILQVRAGDTVAEI